MTYAPPTQTNPPFTSPPTWYAPTTSERWETDYRLRLLEAATIYMWSKGVPGPPLGTPPPTGFNTTTDAYGTVWVSLNGTAWKKATDALHCRVYRNAAFQFPTSPASMPYDTETYDSMNLYNPATSVFTTPIAGIWQLTGMMMCSSMLNGQFINMYFNHNAAQFSQSLHTAFGSEQGVIIHTDRVICAATDTLVVQCVCNTAGNAAGGTPGTTNFATLDYLGTG